MLMLLACVKWASENLMFGHGTPDIAGVAFLRCLHVNSSSALEIASCVLFLYRLPYEDDATNGADEAFVSHAM